RWMRRKTIRNSVNFRNFLSSLNSSSGSLNRRTNFRITRPQLAFCNKRGKARPQQGDRPWLWDRSERNKAAAWSKVAVDESSKRFADRPRTRCRVGIVQIYKKLFIRGDTAATLAVVIVRNVTRIARFISHDVAGVETWGGARNIRR